MTPMTRILLVLSLLGMIASLYAAFVYAPTEVVMGHIQRIFYFHMGSVWVATLAFTIVFISSIAYLKTEKRSWDILALSSAELGVLFITYTIVSGAIWAKPIWGTWWTWDPQLTTTFILWVLYVVYLLLRSSAGGEARRAKYSAVFAIIAYIDLPLVYISARVMRGISPVVFGGRGGGIEPKMWVALVASLLAFTFLFVVLLRLRYALERMGDEVKALRVKEASF
ncbi:MAG: cytochrome c biogenesis protein CcsA [Candidatus Methanosuratincola sp.]